MTAPFLGLSRTEVDAKYRDIKIRFCNHPWELEYYAACYIDAIEKLEVLSS